MLKLMQSASACNASQPHSPASRQSLKSNAATAGSTPTTQACRAVFQETSASPLCTSRCRGATSNCVYRWGGMVNTFFLAHDQSTSFQDQITKDVSCSCKILTPAQVWSGCSGSGHGCQYYRRFLKAKTFELRICEKSMLTLSLPPRSFSLSSLHFRCFRNIAKAARSWSLFSFKVKEAFWNFNSWFMSRNKLKYEWFENKNLQWEAMK